MPPLGLQPPHLARPVVLAQRMWIKVEIEARLASCNLWIPFDARFHSQDTLSRHLLFFNFQRTSRSFDHRLISFCVEEDESVLA